MSSSAELIIALPRSIVLSKRGFGMHLPCRGFSVELEFLHEDASLESRTIRAIVRPSVPAVWSRNRSETALPFYNLGGGNILIPADAALQAVMWVLDFASLESGRPWVHREFMDDLPGRIQSFVAEDAEGIALREIPKPGMVLGGRDGCILGDPGGYFFPSSLAEKALPHLFDAEEAHWGFWQTGYHLALRNHLGMGDRTRELREAIVSFQTSIESSMLVVAGWGETEQYSRDAISQFPVSFHGGLSSVLLTRNLMLHRGGLALKSLRPGELFEDAGRRSVADADGRLDASHALAFAETCFEALRWLENNRNAVAPPSRRKASGSFCKTPIRG